MNTQSPSRLSDNELIAEIPRIVGSQRTSTATLIAHLAEFESRDLHLALGYSSLFVYCQEALRYSEEESYLRMSAARLARKFPLVVAKLSERSVSLSTLRLLAPHLQPNNYEELLAAASGKSKREVQELVAALAPRPDTPLTIRELPAPAALRPPSIAPSTPVFSASASPAPAERPSITPLSPGRQKISFTVSSSTIAKLKQAQDLLRHAIPSGDAGEIFDRALTLLLKDLEQKKCGATHRPRPSRATKPGSRYVPAAVRRAVWKRDGGRCAFVGKTGHRCNETSCLQYHHVDPRGPATVENIQLRCAAHNRYEGALVYGRSTMMRYAGVVKEAKACYRVSAPGTWSRPSCSRRRPVVSARLLDPSGVFQLGRAVDQVRLVDVVGPAAELDVVHGRLAAQGAGNDVVELEVRGLVAAASGLPTKAQRPSSRRQTARFTSAGTVGEPGFVPRLARGWSVAANFFRSRALTNTWSARSRISAMLPSGTAWRRRSWARLNVS